MFGAPLWKVLLWVVGGLLVLLSLLMEPGEPQQLRRKIDSGRMWLWNAKGPATAAHERLTKKVCRLFLDGLDWCLGVKFGPRTLWACAMWGIGSTFLMVAYVFWVLVIWFWSHEPPPALQRPLDVSGYNVWDLPTLLTIPGISFVFLGILPATIASVWRAIKGENTGWTLPQRATLLLATSIISIPAVWLLRVIGELIFFWCQITHNYRPIGWIVVVLSLSVAVDFGFVSFYRWALRTASNYSTGRALAMMVVLALLAHGLFAGPYWVTETIYPPGHLSRTPGLQPFDLHPFRSGFAMVSLMVGLSNAIDIILCYVLMVLTGLVVVHRFLWETSRRVLYPLREFLPNRKWLIGFGAALVLAPFAPNVPSLIGLIVGAFK